MRTSGTGRPILAAAVGTTVASVYPAFLTGALGPELRPALGMSDAFFGVAVGAFFLGAAVGSVVLGRLGERLGPRRMITVALLTTASASVLIATVVGSGWTLMACLSVAGTANSASQTAVNTLLSTGTDPGRLGLAVAIKQSGMPGATLLGGLAVPALALTVGWRWAYAAAAVLAVAALAVVSTTAPRRDTSPAGRPDPHGVLVTARSTLWRAAVAGGFASAAAGTLGNWITSSAVDVGWGTGAAGLLLSVGSVAGITVRLLLGARADRRPLDPPMRRAAGWLFVGALGALVLAPRSTALHLVGSVVAFGAGWSWPALFNLAIVRANPNGAGYATGITQTGVYLGVVTGPAAMGVVVDRFGYGPGWIGVTASMAIGAVVMRTVSAEITTVPAAAAPADRVASVASLESTRSRSHRMTRRRVADTD